MKLHRFYIPQKVVEGHLQPVVFPELVHQMNKVLRLHIGEKVIFFNGDGNEYVSSIVSYEGKETVVLKVEETVPNTVSFNKELYLFFSLIKKDNTDWILEKGTEVGVSHFIPIVSSRSEKKDINIERAQKIVTEATEQCGRNIPPTIHPVTRLEDVFEKFDMPFIVLEKGAPELGKESMKYEQIGLLVGPEGGWTKEELELFKNKKVIFCSLGPTVLRAETAAIIGSAKINN